LVVAFKFFVIPVGDDAAEAELNSFLGNHRVLYVDRHFVNQVGSLSGNRRANEGGEHGLTFRAHTNARRICGRGRGQRAYVCLGIRRTFA